MDPLVVSHVLLWVLQVLTVVALVALTRQVGLLHLRLRPIGPGSVEDGPAPGSAVPPAELVSLRGRPVPFPAAGGLSLLVFASPLCSLCATVLPGLRTLARAERDLTAVVAVDEVGGESLAYLERNGFRDGVAADRLASLDPSHRPYAIAAGADGIVLASGVVNTLEQLEELVATAREATLRGIDATAGATHA